VAVVVAILLALFVVPRPWGWAVVTAAALYEVATFWLGWHWSRSRRAVVGPAALIGVPALVTQDCRPDGWVRVNGELWRARCAPGASVGEPVRVVAIRGLTLVVEPG
jgi:membrane protein implicated in regulation of membrane protease activity